MSRNGAVWTMGPLLYRLRTVILEFVPTGDMLDAMADHRDCGDPGGEMEEAFKILGACYDWAKSGLTGNGLVWW